MENNKSKNRKKVTSKKKATQKKVTNSSSNKLINQFKKDSRTIIMAIISLVALFFGSLMIGFIPSLLIIIMIDLIIYFVVKPKKKTGNKNGKELLKTILIVGFSCATFVLLVGIGFGIYIISTATEFTQEKLYNKDASILYTYNGEEYAKLGTELRQKVTYDELSQSLIDAIIATEDSRFFQHSGVDLPRFLKASIKQVLGGGGGGASTLTMQVSKNAFTSTEDEGIKGIIRKFTDIYISVFKIETHYTKEEILEFYVNSYYMGNGNTGVQQASLDYFGKPASELNVAEAAMIAGLFQAPNAYDPTIHPEACEQRRKTVLSLMLRHGYITQEEYNIAKELTVEKLLKENTIETTEYQDFIDTVVSEVIKRTGNDPYHVPMKIYTTMHKDMQDQMNGVMNGSLYTWKNDTIQGASIVLDVKTGAITAVGAGRNRVMRGENLATEMERQIGSTAKPFYDYGPGIEYNNWSSYTPFTDEPHSYSEGISLRNWDNKYYGFQTLHDALKHSRNIPAVKAFQSLKSEDIRKFVTDLGLSPDDYLHEAHALGGYTGESPLTMAAAYAAFSNGGYYIEPHSFTRIEYTDTGDTYEVKPITRKVMSSETAYIMTKILEDTSSYAVGLSVNGVNYAAKTGTTNFDYDTIKKFGLASNAISDKWIGSFNDSYAIAVWYGYKIPTNKENHLTMSDYSIKKVFQTIAKSVYTSRSTWTKPDNVVQLEVEDQLPTAMLASEYTPSDLKISAYFKKGFEPTETSSRFSQLDNVTNLNYNEKTATLSWNGIETPKFLSTNYLDSLYSNIFKDTTYRQKHINSMISYNNKNLGNVVYNVYQKDATGNLTLLTTTNNTSYVYPTHGSTTFVVKASYSIFKSNMSSGAEFTVNGSSASIISVQLSGESTINLKIGDTYTEHSNPVIVLENGINDVTSQSTITYTVLRNSDKKMFSNVSYIDTSKEDTYTITYHISYGGYKDNVVKNIKISAD